LTDASVNKSFKARETPIDGKAYLLQPVSDATVIAQYVSDMNAQTDPRVSAYLFETSDGKRRAVFGQMIFDRALRTASGDRILQLHRVLDWVAHERAPVVLETPTRSFVQPRVRTDGTLASVVFINASVGDSAPVRLRLRRVPSTARQAIWSSYDSKDMPLTIVREGADALVTLPRLGPWTAGYLFFD
jgi:hypothetical protein